MSMPLRARNITCRRGTKSVVSQVNLTVPAGSRLAVVGPNGAGKSTLLRVLCGLDSPAAGTVEVGGENLHRMSGRRRARIIAVVGQEERPAGELTVGEAVALGRIPYRQPWSASADHDIVRTALSVVELGDRADRPCGRLSGGERHRVVLARALAQQTPVLVLDEPTNHLDAAWRLRLMQLVKDLGRTVVAAMHDLDLVLRYFDAVAVIADGRIIGCGPPVKVLTPVLLREVFGVAGEVFFHPRTGRAHLLLAEAEPAVNRQ